MKLASALATIVLVVEILLDVIHCKSDQHSLEAFPESLAYQPIVSAVNGSRQYPHMLAFFFGIVCMRALIHHTY